jgi:polysaccharide biosynthesis protein PslH
MTNVGTLRPTPLDNAGPTPFQRLLVVANNIPFPPTNGSGLRLWALLRCLAANGHVVDLLTFGDPQSFAPYRDTVLGVCRSVELVRHTNGSLSKQIDFGRRLSALASRLPYGVASRRSNELRTRVNKWLDERRGDAILCEENQQLINLPDTLPVPLIVDNQNAEFVLLERFLAHERNLAHLAYGLVEAYKTKFWERYACSRADVALVCSEADCSHLRRLCPNATLVVAPNVIDTDHYQPQPSPGTQTVLYTGGMDWYPNRDAVSFFVRNILPRLSALIPGVRFIVAGRGPSDEFRRSLHDATGLTFTGTVPDIRTEIAKADVCVVPLRIASGTRLKILEAAAMGQAIVSTSIGAEGLAFSHEREILLADAPHTFAELTALLLQDPRRRLALGRNARSRVEAHYSMPTLRTACSQLMHELSRSVHKSTNSFKFGGPRQ